MGKERNYLKKENYKISLLYMPSLCVIIFDKCLFIICYFQTTLYIYIYIYNWTKVICQIGIFLLFIIWLFLSSFEIRTLSGEKFLCKKYFKYFQSCYKRNNEKCIGDMAYTFFEWKPSFGWKSDDGQLDQK